MGGLFANGISTQGFCYPIGSTGYLGILPWCWDQFGSCCLRVAVGASKRNCNQCPSAINEFFGKFGTNLVLLGNLGIKCFDLIGNWLVIGSLGINCRK